MTNNQDADGYAHLTTRERIERISRRNELFAQWQEANPGKKFADYYGHVIEQHLDGGNTHPTLGKNLLEGRVFGKTGNGMLKRLISLGLEQDHICVDYGCGSLRVGCHFIMHLNPGCYWGLDVNERFISDGRELLGRDLIEKKSPHLHLISDDVITQAQAAKPDFIFSKSVLLHVPPEDLATYFGRLNNLMVGHTKVIIDATISDQTVQMEPLSWAFSQDALTDMAAKIDCSLHILEETPTRIEAAQCDGKVITMMISRLNA